MPKEAIKLGGVDRVLPLQETAGAVLKPAIRGLAKPVDLSNLLKAVEQSFKKLDRWKYKENQCL